MRVPAAYRAAFSFPTFRLVDPKEEIMNTQSAPELVEAFDTTLRDGMQVEGVSATVEDKLRIAEQLDYLGVQFIEGGWPGANPKDIEFFARAATELKFKHSTLVAFGSTRRPKGKVDDDATLRNLLDANTSAVCIVAKSWDYHVTDALQTTLEEGALMVADSVEFLHGNGRQVMVETFRYRLHKMGLGSGKYIPQNHAYEIKTSADSSHGVLLSQLSKKSPCNVLDVGCSDGALGECVRAQGHVVVGIDLERHELVEDRLNKFIQADLDHGVPKDLPGLFDVVLCADVVEHVRQPDVLLNELRAVVAPGGSVLVSIPNFGHWYPRVRTMFGLFDYDRRGILDRTHVRFFTHRSFKRLAQNAGYSVQRVACTGFPFDVLSRENTEIPKFIIAPLRVIDMALVKLRPPFFAYQFIYELKS